MESAYLNLVRGNRLSSLMGLKMVADYPYRNAQNYMYVEIPVRHFELDGEPVTEAKRNQHVFVVPACSINVRGTSIVEVEPNPDLARLGQLQAGYKVHPNSGLKEPGFWFTARKDVKLEDIGYAIRLYMYA